jgi:hypothetical protein
VQLYANNAIGAIFNDSSTPGGGVGVYANQFEHLAVDTFDTYSGRVGVLFNTSSRNQMMAFHQDPAAEGGSIVDNSGRSTSHRILQVGGISGNPSALIEKKGWRYGDLLFGTDAAYDIGASGATRPRTGYFSGGLLAAGTVGVGYATGAGGTVTQITSKSTGVTLNKTCGQITMQAAALAAGAKIAFTVTNSTVAATDVVVVNVVSGGTANAYRANVVAVAAGSFAVAIENITAGSLSEAPVIGFAVVKAVTA